MAELLDAVLSPAVLNAAWKRLAGDHAVWRPGVPRSEMERDMLRHILELISEARTGSYRPESLRRFPVEKGDGKLPRVVGPLPA
jgi:hypothetical protein